MLVGDRHLAAAPAVAELVKVRKQDPIQRSSEPKGEEQTLDDLIRRLSIPRIERRA